MKIIETGLEGLIVIEPSIFGDERGLFYESWRDADYRKIGIQETFLQDNISVSKKNVLRGLHYRKDQGQLATIVQGRVFDVVVDIRPASKTYKQYFSIELDSENPKQIYMAPGFAHGFCVLSDMAILHYKCTQYYDASREHGIIWNDPEIGIQWPSAGHIISSRDQNFKSLKEEEVCKKFS